MPSYWIHGREGSSMSFRPLLSHSRPVVAVSPLAAVERFLAHPVSMRSEWIDVMNEFAVLDCSSHSIYLYRRPKAPELERF